MTISILVKAVPNRAGHPADKGYLSRSLKTLSDLGLVVAKVNAEDARKKNFQITERGLNLLEALEAARKKLRVLEPLPGLADGDPKDVDALVERLSKPVNSEVEDVSWEEIFRLAKETRLWRQDAVMKFIRKALAKKNPPERARDVFGVIRLMVQSGGRDARASIREACEAELKGVLQRRGEWSAYDGECLATLKELLDPTETFRVCLNEWEARTEKIDNTALYDSSIQQLIPFLSPVPPDMLNSTKKRLLLLMESDDDRMRRRVYQMHRTMFVNG